MARGAGQQTRSEAVHDRIRADILGGRLRPGERLKFPELSERYGVSTGAVREALLRLAAKNLVSSEPHHGFQVTDLTPRGLAELTDARSEIESLALTRAISDGDLAWEGQVLAAHHTFEQTPLADDNGDEPGEAWLVAHADFHTALLAGCANRRLRDLAASLREEAELYRRWLRPAAPDAHAFADPAGHEEHRALLDAVMARDSEQAAAVLRGLIALTAELVLDTEPPA
ncbi:GntR family transcriptional regulator [Amycolatopsis sp., V23-08]|uniref:GntR family transcriptional regulator n=1 Tax=Amycolatopsis heterodermiae TaxID=3110235 RepID=A0ABU5R8C1_9PSEU|nr:GntR family transcriptional regulator [Amycolatopsis sp., V23-08]MEA5362482.1 GntR family transcriptional regulator [Amycolatopsis sp., V23-08]